MFDELITKRKLGSTSIFISLAAHCAAAWLILWVLAPRVVRVSSVALGNRGTDRSLIYLPAHGFETQSVTALHSPRKPAARRKSRPSPLKAAPQQTVAAIEQPRAGSSFGTLPQGPIAGSEARPALPVVFPDPPRVSRSELAAEGDVVVEITIDALGNVVDTKILQSLGSGIDKKVLAALRDWRFTPATVDGHATPSRQDVYFHFPNS
jgi:TonB family protein